MITDRKEWYHDRYKAEAIELQTCTYVYITGGGHKKDFIVNTTIDDPDIDNIIQGLIEDTKSCP